MANIGITGGTGFIGPHIIKLLLAQGHKITVFTRSKKRSANGVIAARWDAAKKQIDAAALAELDAMIHLAGANVAGHRWTDDYKRKIVSSRVRPTEFLVQQINLHAPRCKTFISASAIGWYGPDRKGKIPFTEDAPPSNDFLGRTCAKWEAASAGLPVDCRRIILRFGIVFGRDDGAYKQFALPVKFGIEPLLGGGRQIVSWIHIRDLAGIVVHSLAENFPSGIYNAVAPKPVSQKQVEKKIATAKNQFSLAISVPSLFLKITLGEMSTEILKSCTVSSAKIEEAGYEFLFPEIKTAVDDLERAMK